MILSDKRIYIHKKTRRRIAIIKIERNDNKLKLRYLISGHSSWYLFKDFVKCFEVLE